MRRRFLVARGFDSFVIGETFPDDGGRLEDNSLFYGSLALPYFGRSNRPEIVNNKSSWYFRRGRLPLGGFTRDEVQRLNHRRRRRLL